jgi:hypothetical protein
MYINPQAAFWNFANRQMDPTTRNGRAEFLKVESFSPQFSRSEFGTQVFRFSNGAIAVVGYDSCSFQEVPVDPINRGRAIREYLLVQVEMEEKAFNAYQAGCSEDYEMHKRYANHPPGATERSERYLTDWKAKIDRIRSEIAEIDRMLAETPEGRVAAQKQRFEAEMVAQRQAETAAYAAAIRGLSI